MSVSLLADPLFPDRSWYSFAETGETATKALVGWAKGGRFHPYGTIRHQQPDYQYGEHRENPGKVEFTGELQDWSGHMTWSVRYQRVGEPDNWGSSSGCPTAEDAAYAACTMIEEYEREQYELNLVVGVA